MKKPAANLTLKFGATTKPRAVKPLITAGLFAGIAGVELGLERAGHSAALFCEIEPTAVRVLKHHFPKVPVALDVRELSDLPRVGLITAGFPCQDLSQAGRTAGITGVQSGLVKEVFRILEEANPRWLLLENVPFMLALDRGEAMGFLAKTLTRLGYRWAYRVVNSRAFGLPQRRHRVLLLASRTEDPRGVLLVDEAGDPPAIKDPDAFGFYWTEGTKGLGWAIEGVPTLKGGSTIGIPSPPAIWVRSADVIVTPDIRDAERMQGFPADWTAPSADDDRRNSPRWKLVGNAVSVPVAEWIGSRLLEPGAYEDSADLRYDRTKRWPTAAWSDESGRIFESSVSMFPKHARAPRLMDFLKYPTRQLSLRAAEGFLRRARGGNLRFMPGFLDAVQRHIRRCAQGAAA